MVLLSLTEPHPLVFCEILTNFSAKTWVSLFLECIVPITLMASIQE